MRLSVFPAILLLPLVFLACNSTGPSETNGLVVSSIHDTTVAAGNSAIFTVTATGGGGVLKYQWRKDSVDLLDDTGAGTAVITGTVIMGARTNQLKLEDVWSGDMGSYTCTVISENGSASPANVSARLTVTPSAVTSSAHLEQLLYNPKWYRTYDSTADIVPADGSLLFAWSYGDSTRRHPDSFFVGIDTLWSLPQNVDKDTANDWDLQVCPDGFCMNGLKAGVHGANAPIHFGDTGEFGDTSYQTEHHFQFFPALSTSYQFTAPDSSLFGALMYVRSRSTGAADTVFGFGAWKLPWDSAYPPPLRPVAGYLPKRSDFAMVGGKVRYLHGNQ